MGLKPVGSKQNVRIPNSAHQQKLLCPPGSQRVIPDGDRRRPQDILETLQTQKYNQNLK